MFKKIIGCLAVAGLLLFTASYAFAWCSGDCDCCRCPTGQAQCLGSYSSCEAACGLISESSGSGNSGYDSGAAIREQQRQEAERLAEEQRQRDAQLEQQRRMTENKRRLEEIERQNKFFEERDVDAGTLRGSTGVSAGSSWTGSSALRGSTTASGSGSAVLRGSGANTGLRDSKTDATPNTDPMVVDARVSPYGADLLSQVPELERSPASDRIRKGFQAIMKVPRDWPVALAWWQEALQRDPSNIALMRSVDLAQWMVESKKRATDRQSATSYPSIDAFMRGDATDVIQLVEQAKKDDAIKDAEAERMTKTINKQLKERDAATKPSKLSKKTASMTEMAAAGDRALSEQMFEDGLLFLNMGDYEHAEQMFKEADFFRMFDNGKPFSTTATTGKTQSKTGKKK